MNKKTWRSAFIFFGLSLNLSAAEYIEPSSSTPAKIKVQNAIHIMPSGQRAYTSIELTAKDTRGLYSGQIYQVHFSHPTSHLQDGTYSQREGFIFIPQVPQADILLHRITLKQLSGNEYYVVEDEISAIPMKNQNNYYSGTGVVVPTSGETTPAQPKLPTQAPSLPVPRLPMPRLPAR